jgi:type II secretory pathway pseudopilin PulG
MMKKYAKSMLGVTLLEIMLVLAIAAMIIVMSIRYYQSATSSQQANQALAQIQAISAAADNLAQGTGSYASGGVDTASVSQLVPAGSMTAPWGGAITVSGASASTYTVNIGATPGAVCPLLASRLTANNHFTNVSSCTGAASGFSYTYVANP